MTNSTEAVFAILILGRDGSVRCAPQHLPRGSGIPRIEKDGRGHLYFIKPVSLRDSFSNDLWKYLHKKKIYAQDIRDW